MNKQLNVVVTGVTGKIGYMLAFMLSNSKVFNNNDISFRILARKSSLPKAEGIKMEMIDSGFSSVKEVIVTDKASEAFRDANLAIFVAGLPRKAGQNRSDLIKNNALLFKEYAKDLNSVASKDCKSLVVANPCITNAYILKEIANKLDENNFYGLTYLDELRIKAQLAMMSNVSIDEVSIPIFGNHSPLQVYDYENAKIANKNLLDIKSLDELRSTITPLVANRGSQIIQNLGNSAVASTVIATLKCVEDMYSDTKNKHFYSLAKCSNGEYLVKEGIIFGFPVYTKDGNIMINGDFKLKDYQQEAIENNVKELQEEAKLAMSI